MRYVVVLPEAPLPADSGGRLANLHLCNGLVEDGHEVFVVALGASGNVSSDPWPVIGISVKPEGWSRYPLWRIRRMVSRRRHPFAAERDPAFRRGILSALDRLSPDVVVFHHTYAWMSTGRPDLLICQNIESHRLRRARVGQRKLSFVEAMERTALRNASEVVVFSEIDSRRAEDLEPGCTPVMIPLGVAPKHSRRVRQPERLRSVAFIGSFNYAPNREAAEILAGQAQELADLGIDRIVLAGRSANSLPASVRGCPVVSIHSDVPDIQALLQEQDLLIVPLINGGGVRVKILESWALGVPVVSTSLGIEGLGATHGVEALIGDGPKDLVRLVSDATSHRLRSSLAEEGWHRWSRHHSPAAFAAGFDAVARRVVAKAQLVGSI